MSSGYRGRICVFLKYFWAIFIDDSLKASHVSTRTNFHVDWRKLRGYMVSHTVCYLITIQMIEINIWIVIFFMVMHRITCFKDERPDVVSKKYIQCPTINMYAMAIIEEHSGVYGIRATYGGKMGHGFMPTINIHTSWWWIVDYTITGYVIVEILSLVGSLMHHHRGE